MAVIENESRLPQPRRNDRIALDLELGPGDLRGLGEFRTVARLHDHLVAERLAYGGDRLGRFLRGQAALQGVRGGQKAIDLARNDGRELEHCHKSKSTRTRLRR